MLPILKFLSDGETWKVKEICEEIYTLFKVTDDEKILKQPSGEYIVKNRVGWAISHLDDARLIEAPRRGKRKITVRGLELLKEGPNEIGTRLLMRYPDFVAAKKKRLNSKG